MVKRVSLTDFEHGKSLLKNAKKVVAFSGAGISTDSGLSDFRSLGGLWERYRIVTYQEFLSDPKSRAEYWSMRRELIPSLLNARPNQAHMALASLEASGKIKCVITQNIDGLHQAAGSQNVIELHGTNMTASCLGCSRQWPINDIQKRLERGELDLLCHACHGLIKPDTVSFGQAMPEKAMERAFREAAECDLFLMIGSSLEVQPANQIPLTAFQSGAKLIFINRDPTPFDHLAEVSLKINSSEAMACLVDLTGMERKTRDQRKGGPVAS